MKQSLIFVVSCDADIASPIDFILMDNFHQASPKFAFPWLSLTNESKVFISRRVVCES